MACTHYADLYGRCIDCGATWAERAAERQTPSCGDQTRIDANNLTCDEAAGHDGFHHAAAGPYDYVWTTPEVCS